MTMNNDKGCIFKYMIEYLKFFSVVCVCVCVCVCDRETECEWGGAEREGDTESKAVSGL